MSNEIIYISYYTKNSPYEKVMNTYLLPSLKKFNLSYDIDTIKDFGTWQRNTSYKAQFVLQKLLQHKKTVVFIDCDATIEQYPSLFAQIPPEYDIAVHYQDWWKQWKNDNRGIRFDLLSGTIMFRYNIRVLNIVRQWVERTKTSSAWEQKILQELTEHDRDLIKIYKLPVEYCTVIMHDKSIPKYIKKDDVVILHHQASRRLKNRRNWK